MSDGRVVNGMLPYGTNVVMGLPSTAAVSTPKPPRPPPAVPPKPKPSTPFFAAPVIEKLSQPPPPPPPLQQQQQQVKAVDVFIGMKRRYRTSLVGDPVPLNRTDIIHHAARVLEKIHKENEEHRKEIQRLKFLIAQQQQSVRLLFSYIQFFI